MSENFWLDGHRDTVRGYTARSAVLSIGFYRDGRTWKAYNLKSGDCMAEYKTLSGCKIRVVNECIKRNLPEMLTQDELRELYTAINAVGKRR
jgi:hypothetical protein